MHVIPQVISIFSLGSSQTLLRCTSNSILQKLQARQIPQIPIPEICRAVLPGFLPKHKYRIELFNYTSN